MANCKVIQFSMCPSNRHISSNPPDRSKHPGKSSMTEPSFVATPVKPTNDPISVPPMAAEPDAISPRPAEFVRRHNSRRALEIDPVIVDSVKQSYDASQSDRQAQMGDLDAIIRHGSLTDGAVNKNKREEDNEDEEDENEDDIYFTDPQYLPKANRLVFVSPQDSHGPVAQNLVARDMQPNSFLVGRNLSAEMGDPIGEDGEFNQEGKEELDDSIDRENPMPDVSIASPSGQHTGYQSCRGSVSLNSPDLSAAFDDILGAMSQDAPTSEQFRGVICDELAVKNLLHPKLIYPLITIVPPWSIHDILVHAFHLCQNDAQKLDLFTQLVDMEIDMISTVETSKLDARLGIFYEKSTFHKICHAFHVVVGFQYIGYILSDVISSILRETLRIDIVRNRPSDEQEEIGMKVTFSVKMVIDVIITKFPELPIIYRNALKVLDEIFAKYFSEYRLDSIMYFLLASFTMQPIIKPQTYGLYPFPPTNANMEILATICKIVQNVSLRREFSSGPYDKYNGLIIDCYRVFMDFCIKAQNYPIPPIRANDETKYEKILRESRLVTFLSILQEQVVRLVKVSPHTIFYIKKLISCKLLVVPRETLVALEAASSSKSPDLNDHAVLQSLIVQMRRPGHGIVLSERVVKSSLIFNSKQEKCFCGSEAVDWLIVNTREFDMLPKRERRPKAVELGHRLLKCKVFVGITSSNTFKDSDALYKFSEDQNLKSLNSLISWNAPISSPLDEVYDLLSRIINLYDSHVSLFGEISKEALCCIKNTPKYREFRLLTAKLQKVNLEPLSDDDRLCFFINVYNILSMHATVESAHTFKQARPWSFFQQSSYDIGGEVYTLVNIEHGIIRGNSAAPQLIGNFATPLTKFDRRDPRHAYVIRQSCYFINFALWSGHKSGPRVRIYHGDNIGLDLKQAAKDYIEEHIQYDTSKNEIQLPKILDFYQQDFGGSRFAISRWLTSTDFLSKSIVNQVLMATEARGELAITFAKYNSDFSYETDPDSILELEEYENVGSRISDIMRRGPPLQSQQATQSTGGQDANQQTEQPAAVSLPASQSSAYFRRSIVL